MNDCLYTVIGVLETPAEHEAAEKESSDEEDAQVEDDFHSVQRMSVCISSKVFGDDPVYDEEEPTTKDLDMAIKPHISESRKGIEAGLKTLMGVLVQDKKELKNNGLYELSNINEVSHMLFYIVRKYAENYNLLLIEVQKELKRQNYEHYMVQPLKMIKGVYA